MGLEDASLSDLVESLRAEQRRRWRAGDRVAAEAYFALHPRLLADRTCALKMVYNEVLLRESEGGDTGLDDYLRRFPQYAEQLAPLLEVHRALESGLPAAAEGTAADETLP